MTEHLSLYVQGLVLAYAWMEIRHRSKAPGLVREVGRVDRLLAGASPYLLFLLLVLLTGPAGGRLQSGLAVSSLVLLGGMLLVEGLGWPPLSALAVELAAYGILVAHGLSIPFTQLPHGRFMYFTAAAPLITVLWLFAFSRVLRLTTVLPGLFEGMLALLAYLFLGSLYVQRQAAGDTYGLVLVFAGVTTGLWFYSYRLRRLRVGPAAAACWAMAAGMLSIVGTSKRLAFISIVPPTLVLLAPVFFFTYLIVTSYLGPKFGERRKGRVAYRWNIAPDRIATLLLLFCLLGNLVALMGFLSGDPFLVLGPGLFAGVLFWRLASQQLKISRIVERPDHTPETVPVMGIPIWTRGEEAAVERLRALIRGGGRHMLVTPDSLALYRARSDSEYRSILQNAAMCVPDGAGVVWAGDFLYEAPILSRIPGVELVERLLDMARREGFRAYFLGSSRAVITRAREVLEARYPGVQIVGARDGFFTEAQEPEVIAEINALEPHLIFVAMGVPKQERFIARNLRRLRTSLMMGVGGTFDVISGEKKRSPVFLQRCGLEWLWRVLREPHRINRIANLPLFVLEVMREKVQAPPLS